MNRADKPPAHVLRTFGAEGEPEPLAGGTGRSWRIGELVLKPLDRSPELHRWEAELLAELVTDGFRVARPRAEIIDGWTASTFVEGRHERGRWREIIAVGERLHAALAGAGPPPRSDNPWETGDRVAWGEQPYPAVDDLLAALERVGDRPQLIHGDLTGNVLFHSELPPAIIDLAPYFRPRQFASAIVVADAICWEDAPLELAELVPQQYLLRALIYRGVTSIEFGGNGATELDLARRIAAQ